MKISSHSIKLIPVLLAGIFLLFSIPYSSQAQSTAKLRAAAGEGDTKAMMTLAERYRFGFDATQNEDSANFYVQKAADEEHPGAQYLLGIEKVRKVYSARSFDAGISLLKKSADNGSVDAMLKLHQIYLDKGGDTQSARYYSTKKAYSYAESAAQKGNPVCGLYCAQVLLNPRKSPTDDSLGLAYLHHAAARKKLPQAQLFLGKMYFEGKADSTRNLGQAFNWYSAVLNNKKSSLEHKTQADFAIFDLDQTLKMTHNQMMHSMFLLPEGQMLYRLREK